MDIIYITGLLLMYLKADAKHMQFKKGFEDNADITYNDAACMTKTELAEYFAKQEDINLLWKYVGAVASESESYIYGDLLDLFLDYYNNEE